MRSCSYLCVALGFALLNSLVNGDILVYMQNPTPIIEEEFRDMPARFGPSIPTEGLRAVVALGSPRDGCTALEPRPRDPNYTGKWIVLIARFNCSFEQKVRNSQAAGYDGVIVHNVNSSDLEIMSAKNSEGIKIPSVFVSETSGLIIEVNYLYKDGYFVIVNGDLPININTHLLLPFAIVVGLCFIIMTVFMITKCVRDRRRARRHRLPSSSLKKIPTSKFAKGDPYDMCAICLDDYVEGDKLRVLPCSHAYHCKCIDPWLTKNRRVCPVCKRKVFARGERPVVESGSDSDDDRAPLVSSPVGNTTQAIQSERDCEAMRCRYKRIQCDAVRRGGSVLRVRESFPLPPATVMDGGTFTAQSENPFSRASRDAARTSASESGSVSSGGSSPPAARDRNVNQLRTTQAGSCPEQVWVRQGEPFLAGLLSIRERQLKRLARAFEDREPLLVESTSPASRSPSTRLVNEQEREMRAGSIDSRSRLHRSVTSSDRQPTPTADTGRPSCHSGRIAPDNSSLKSFASLSSDRHSINDDYEPGEDDQGQGRIGVAALPNSDGQDGNTRGGFIV